MLSNFNREVKYLIFLKNSDNLNLRKYSGHYHQLKIKICGFSKSTSHNYFNLFPDLWINSKAFSVFQHRCLIPVHPSLAPSIPLP